MTEINAIRCYRVGGKWTENLVHASLEIIQKEKHNLPSTQQICVVFRTEITQVIFSPNA